MIHYSSDFYAPGLATRVATPEALQVHVGDPGDPETLRWVNSGGDGTGA